MREIQCKRCFFFTPEWCTKKRDSLDPDLIRDCQYFRIKTNADKIRAMPDEVLAKFIENPYGNPWYRCNECKWESCAECCLEWLKQECDDNGT